MAILIFGFIIRSVTLFRAVRGDEGSFLYFGWMIVKGKVLYRDLFNEKAPGVFFIVAFIFFLFGKNIFAVRILSMLLSILTALIIFKIGVKINNPLMGLISAILYEFEPISLFYSTQVYTETFMIFFLVLAVYFYIPANEKNSYWHYLFVGILIGLSAIMRQTGALLLFVITLHRVYNRDTIKRFLQSIGILIIGVLLSIIPIIIYFQAVNALSDAIYDIILYKLSYSYGFTLFKTLEIFINQVFLQNIILWIVGLGGALFALERRKNYDFFLVAWFLISFFVIMVMSTPYDHYYIQGMPAISLLGGIFVEKLINIHEKIVKGNPQSKAFASSIKWLLVSFVLIGSLLFGVSRYLDMKYVQGLPYQIEAADYIKAHTSPDEIILSPDAAYYLLTDRENKYKLAQLSVGNIESFGISDLPQFLESQQVRYIILDQHAVRWRFNEDSYRNFFNDEIRATEVKIVFEWILENYVLEKTFGSGTEEIYIYHSQYW
jgi:hypothetical protein